MIKKRYFNTKSTCKRSRLYFEPFNALLLDTYPTKHPQDLENNIQQFLFQECTAKEDIFQVFSATCVHMYLSSMYIITVVQVYLVVRGASQNQIRTYCPIPDLFRTIFDTLVRIRTKSGIPDLFGHTENIPTLLDIFCSTHQSPGTYRRV